MRRLSALLLPFLLLAGCTPPEGHPPRQGSAQPSPQAFDGRQPATPLSYQHADWLEREGRDQMEKPEMVIEAMNLKDGDQWPTSAPAPASSAAGSPRRWA